jgi:addiction module RelE/StbE family toxin
LKIRYSAEAASLIRNLHPEVKSLVRKVIRDLLANPLLGHELHRELSGFRSYRLKGYRVIYQVNDPEGFLEIHHVGRRRDVYANFQSLLAEKRSG